ncbi:hypothetical protein [Dysgonomonas sp. 511]|nr:hypothetical protein [Dysgonomonas sp. 511]
MEKLLNDTENKKPYIAPGIEVIEVKIERGFAGSGNENPNSDENLDPNW